MQTICLNKGDEMYNKKQVHSTFTNVQMQKICHKLYTLYNLFNTAVNGSCILHLSSIAELTKSLHLVTSTLGCPEKLYAFACMCINLYLFAWMCKTFQVPKNVNLTHLIASVHEKSYASEKKSDLSCSTKSVWPPPVAPRNCQSNKFYFVISCRNWLIKRDMISHNIT